MKEKKLLIIFIKNPEKGKVKTRLAETLGDEKAFSVYLKLLDFTIGTARRVNTQKKIYVIVILNE